MIRTPHLLLFPFAAILFIAWSGSQDTAKARRDSVQARNTTPVSVRDTAKGPPQFRRVTNVAFGVGERLVFDVNFGYVTAGEAVMQVAGYDYHAGRRCYRIQFEVNTLPFFSAFYKVEDRYLTLIDEEGIFPWRFEQRIREGGFKRDFTAEFDQVAGIAKTTDGKTLPIPPYVHDIVSAFYYARTLDFTGFKVGQRVRLQNFYKDSTFILDVKYRGKQTVVVHAGTFNCIVVEPLVKEGGLFKSEGNILVWLTDDERKLPIQVTSKILIGSISGELREYSGISGPIRAKIK